MGRQLFFTYGILEAYRAQALSGWVAVEATSIFTLHRVLLNLLWVAIHGARQTLDLERKHLKDQDTFLLGSLLGWDLGRNHVFIPSPESKVGTRDGTADSSIP